ncbi:hypothetical protein C8R42DRAFT_780361 [Lentinula raphanica]|nr:hypothetical protein C8R42DRAFT_780361 [Lentinula raphanica]
MRKSRPCPPSKDFFHAAKPYVDQARQKGGKQKTENVTGFGERERIDRCSRGLEIYHDLESKYFIVSSFPNPRSLPSSLFISSLHPRSSALPHTDPLHACNFQRCGFRFIPTSLPRPPPIQTTRTRMCVFVRSFVVGFVREVSGWDLVFTDYRLPFAFSLVLTNRHFGFPH